MRAGFFARAIETVGQRAVENVIDQRRFAGAGDAGDYGHHAQREGDVDVFQLFSRAPRTVIAFPLGARGSERAAMLARPEMYWPVSDSGCRMISVACRWRRPRHRAASAGAEIDDVIGAADGVLIVLDNQHGVPEIAQ